MKQVGIRNTDKLKFEESLKSTYEPEAILGDMSLVFLGASILLTAILLAIIFTVTSVF